LLIVLGLVGGSGILGLVLQSILPRLLTERIGEETPYEQMPHVCRQLSRRAVQITQTICGAESKAVDLASARGQLRNYFDNEIAPFLAGNIGSSATLLDPARTSERFAQFMTLPELSDQRPGLTELEALCEQRRQIAVQERLHHWLHGWLLVHVPLSIALLILGLVHIVMAIYY
jgi:hypothetical protein